MAHPPKNQNKYDHLIEKMLLEFSKIENFNLMHEDAKGNKIFRFVVKRIVEINSFKTLFTNYYLPAASKSVVDDLSELAKSKYKHLFQISREELKENYYETVRLAYIGMFHKYENYIDDLITHAELLGSELNEKGTSLISYIENTFSYKIKDWRNSTTVARLNWISICNKHYDGCPRKKPISESYKYLPENEKMKFTKEDFVRDIDLLISHYNLMLQLVFLFALHKITLDRKTIEIDEFTDIELHQKIIEQKNGVNENIINMINTLKML